MDFKKLMQYATANQMLTEKKHERQKQRREEEQHEEMVRQVEEERRAARRLKEARAKAEKQRREYKGLTDRAVQAKQVPSCNSTPNTTSPAVTTATSSKSKAESTGSSTVKQKASNSTTGSKSSSQPQKQNHKQQQPSNPMPPGVSTSSKGKMKTPVNFQDLLKIAQQKSGEVAEKEKNSKLIMRGSPPSRGTSPADPGSKSTPTGASASRGGSPVGKSLLDRASSRVKKRTHNEMEKTASSDSVSTVVLNNSPVDMAGKGGRNPPVENGVYPHGAASLQQRGDIRSTGGASVMRDRPLQPKAPAQPPANRTHVSPPLPQAHQRQRPRARMDTMKSKSFYGAASAKLAAGERPAFRTKHAPMKYTSTWVDEMSDYIQKKGHRLEGEGEEDEEDEDDLADFVASDDEEGLGEDEDYSSAICQIFGYDKRRFAEEKFDDRMMESSYAQQMFEEQRSAKIGRTEDEEDVRREQVELAQKRRKKMGQEHPGGKPLVQTRLHFR